MGDPFMEKLLLEACLEAMATGAVLGIQDMGAAGLTCSTREMGARGELGVSIELDKVPQRATGMTAYEIMLSESQERMLLVADKGREGEVLAVFAKWGLDASIVGIVTADDTMRVTHHGELVAEIPNKALTDDAPLYNRPVGVWKCPAPLDPPAWVLEELKKPRDYTADLKKLLASANICDKRWVFEQYDSMVQTNTVQGPGGEAGVMRIKGTGQPAVRTAAGVDAVIDGVIGFVPFGLPQTDVLRPAQPERGIAMALAGNGRWAWLDPKLGAMHAVAEAARKVACTGATPVAATNCLNFGNPEKPEIMAQLSAAIDGIAEACTALGTPVTGGNVSLYNETKGEGIYPTPVIGIVGLLEDVSKAVPSGFQNIGDVVLHIYPTPLWARTKTAGPSDSEYSSMRYRELGSTEFARQVTGHLWGQPPELRIDWEADLHKLLAILAEKRLVSSASDISDGGLLTALAKATMQNGVGFVGDVYEDIDTGQPSWLFAEDPSSVIVSCPKSNQALVRQLASDHGFECGELGHTVANRLSLSVAGALAVDEPIAELQKRYSGTLESQLASEVVTA
jgi:phosphoribosylformylglycinamidine synthase